MTNVEIAFNLSGFEVWLMRSDWVSKVEELILFFPPEMLSV